VGCFRYGEIEVVYSFGHSWMGGNSLKILLDEHCVFQTYWQFQIDDSRLDVFDADGTKKALKQIVALSRRKTLGDNEKEAKTLDPKLIVRSKQLKIIEAND
jgi:hypothetical protein